MKNNWKKVKLKDFVDIIMGQSPKSEFYTDNISDIPFFQGCTEFGEMYPIPKKFCSKPTKIAEKNDVLMTVRAPVGDLNIAIEKCCIGRGICALRPKNKNTRFLFYLLKINKNYILNFENGAVYGSVNKDTIENFELDLPPKDIQQKIASVLSAYDDLIEVNNKRIKILEEMARRIYKEWFVNFKFPGYEKAKFKNGVPEGWNNVQVESLLKRIQSGKKYNNKTASIEGKVPILDQGRSGIIGYHNDAPGIIASGENPIIVFANHTCYQNLIMYPFSAIQNILPFYPSDENYRNIFWLHWATKDLIVLNDYKGHWPEFIAKKLLLPSASICEEFGNLIKPGIVLRYKLEKINNNLRRTRDLLLPKLISGKIEL